MDDVSTRVGPGPEFCDLPCELQLLVLSYLSHGELVLVARVSKALRRLAYDPCLWRTVTVREDMDDRWLQGALDRLSQLEALTLRGSPLVPAWAAHAARFPKLRLLDVGFSLDVNGAALSHFVDGCPLLSHLNVEGCKGVDDAAVEALCPLAGLLSVNMSHCCQVTDDGLLALARGSPRLVLLNADGISRITDRAVCGLAEHLGPRLVCLELDGEQLTDASFRALRRCSRLETLSVSYAENLTDASLASIKELRTLRRLKLRRGPQLTARGLGSLFRGGSLGRLISLELDSLALDDQALALLVKGCPHLQVLSLPWCWDITEAGLATIVNNCPNLESLVLLGLYKIHGFCLAGLAVSMPKLRYLHLEQCNEVVDLLLESLARRLPHLRVYNYYGELVGPLYESSGTPSLDMEASKDKEDSGADDRLLLLC
uniref:Putative f-box protein n=1 Tax=Ixodes ricinus TaxID=34613 RepID=A0A147BQJ4_IXORI